MLQRGPLRPAEKAMRTELSFQRKLRRMLVAATIVGPVALTPEMSAAQGLLDFLFGGGQKQQPQTSSFGNPFNNNPQSPPPQPVIVSAGPAFCVRSCDGKYFPLMRGAAAPAQMCQAFCPASPTKVFFGSNIDRAYAATGERYADSENALPIGRRCAPIAPATATILPVLRQSISRWTARYARATRSPPLTGSSPLPANGSVTTRTRISRHFQRPSRRSRCPRATSA